MAAVAVIILLIIGGVFYVVYSQNKSTEFSNPNGTTSDSQVQTITAEELGLVITVRPDNLAVKFKLNKADDIKHVDYQITYMHVVEDSPDPVSEGVTGEMNIAQDGITETDYRTFGTCSATCRYDKEVSDVKLVLKVEKKDGKIYSLEQAIPLNPTEE